MSTIPLTELTQRMVAAETSLTNLSSVPAARASAPTIIKPMSYWLDQIITKNYVIDASRSLPSVSFANGAYATAAQLAAYGQSDNMMLLSNAIEAKVRDIQSQLSINQYFRGGIEVILPDGIIPLDKLTRMFAGKVTYRGHGQNTVFAKVNGDYGDMLHFYDPVREPDLTYVKGNNELHDFSVIDLTATSHGGLVVVDNFEFGVINNIRLHNGCENLVVMGCNNTKFSNIVSRSDSSLGAGSNNQASGMLAGSTLLSLRTAYNGDVEFFNCTFAGADGDHRYTQDAILIQSADVVTFIGGEHGCVGRSTAHINNVSGLSNQAVKFYAANLDDKTGCHIFVDGYQGAGSDFGQNSSFDCQFFGTDNNCINIQNPKYYGGTFKLNATGAAKEAVVCKGYSCHFEGSIRGVGTAATSNRQYSAIWMAGVANTVRNMTIEGSATQSLAYAVEAAPGYYGQTVQASTFIPGANAVAAVSYNDGNLYVGDINCVGGAPVQATSSTAPRTVPTTIS